MTNGFFYSMHVNVIVNTYGMSDPDFAALRDRWTARWTAAVKDPEIIPES